jgi:hypothetical protein
MADLNKSFFKFHDAIALDQELKTLREKREAVIDRLIAGLESPKPTIRNQGSYALGTGIKPHDGKSNYDIDIALEFALDPNKIGAVALKRQVFAAVQNHTQNVQLREPCITITYQREGEPIYHVDLAVYASHGGSTFLARGVVGSSKQDDRWDPADPAGLVAYVKTHPSDASHREQWRRVVRYLKRWKDLRFSSEGQAAPRGIALSACALKWFQFCETELDAVLGVVAAMHQQGPNIAVLLPVAPHDDLFRRMNDEQRANLHARLGELQVALRGARDEPDPVRAAESLRKQFGEDFPLPDKRATAAGAAAIGTSGASA